MVDVMNVTNVLHCALKSDYNGGFSIMCILPS